MVKVSSLNGKKVITKDAFTVGAVSGAEVNTGNWQITHLHISLAKEATEELGFKKPLLGHITICLPINHIEAFGDVITLRPAINELKNTPECKHG